MALGLGHMALHNIRKALKYGLGVQSILCCRQEQGALALALQVIDSTVLKWCSMVVRRGTLFGVAGRLLLVGGGSTEHMVLV